jgi:hypothetical protein
MMLMYAGCRSPQPETGGDKGIHPLPSPEQGLDLGDTPIVISGGSVHLELNNATFKLCTAATAPQCPTPAGTNVMYWAPGKITASNFYDDNDLPGAELPHAITITDTSIITIKCAGGGDSGDIVITNDKTGHRVLVEFDETGKFKPLHPGAFRRVSRKFKIDTLKTQNPTTDYTPSLPPNKKVIIELTGTP